MVWYYIKSLEVLVLLLAAVYLDYKHFKIKNQLILTGMVVGVLTNLIQAQADGVIDSLLGIITPIVLLFILFALRMLGAGDVKLFSAIGSIAGVKFVLYTLATSMLFGGMLAIIIMVFRKNAIRRFGHLFNYMKLCLITFRLHEYQQLDSNDKGQFRFSYAIAGGTVLTLVLYRNFFYST